MKLDPAISAVLLTAGLLPGCQTYLFEQKCPEAVSEARASLVREQPVPVDILFVIDNSGSMADEQENLVRNFDAFIGVLAGSNLDYRIAVVSTDVGSRDVDLSELEQAGLAGFEVDTSSPFRPVDSSDDSNCRSLDGVRHGCFRSGRAEPWIDSRQDDAALVPNLFAEAARVGTCGSGRERGTTALVAALDNTAENGCNAGFLRADANLVVIIVSDEDDFDPSSPTDLLEQLAARKPLEQIRVAVIGGFVEGNASACGANPDGSVTSACGSLCDMPRPSADVQGPCPSNGASCPGPYICADVNGQARCASLAWFNYPNQGTGFGCDSCSSFDVQGCCAADVGASRYLSFATALEGELARRDALVAATNCQGATMGRSVCLVDSICQAEFADTLQRIARELVVTNTLTLDPPATNPEGIVVQLRGGRYPDQPRILTAGAEYVIDEQGVRLELITADVLPQDGEELEVFFTVDTTVDGPRVGICE